MDRQWTGRAPEQPAQPPYWGPTPRAPPWGAADRAESTRRKPTQSPRRRTKGKQDKGQKGKSGTSTDSAGKGKAPGGALSQVPPAPTAEALPSAPAKPALPQPMLPKVPAVVGPSAERQALDALVQSLVSAKMPIPTETQALLDQMRQEDAQSSAKIMHRAVSQQAAARKDLGAVRSLRAAYMNEWSTYLSSVADLLDQQITEQTQVLASLDEREQQAIDTLLKAKADLARLAAENSRDREADDMDASEAMVDDAIEFEAQRRDARAAAMASTEQLQTTLRGLRQQAVEQAEDARRDGSRTPRRRSKETAIDLTTEEAKQAAGGDKAGDKEAAEASKAKKPPG